MVVRKLPPPSRKFVDPSSCVKCGLPNASTRWCAPGARVRCVAAGEHLHRTCARCGFGWLEATLDSEDVS